MKWLWHHLSRLALTFDSGPSGEDSACRVQNQFLNLSGTLTRHCANRLVLAPGHIYLIARQPYISRRSPLHV